MTAKKAFSRQESLGLVDDLSFDDWRRVESVACCGKRVSQATQRDFLKLDAHFSKLAGLHARHALKTAKRLPKARERKENTPEKAEQYRHLIAQELGMHYKVMRAKAKAARPVGEEPTPEQIGAIGWPYVHKIAANKFKGTPLEKLDAIQTEQLLYTIRNRIAAKEGREEVAGRNKKQGRALMKPEPEIERTPTDES